jgi:hypothetical protein
MSKVLAALPTDPVENTEDKGRREEWDGSPAFVNYEHA